MDPPAVDPIGISVPIYDEDPEENFIGPGGIVNLFQEEERVLEVSISISQEGGAGGDPANFFGLPQQAAFPCKSNNWRQLST